MSVNPTQFILSQLQAKAAKYKELSNFFEFLLNGSRSLESVSFKMKHNKDVFRFNMDESENSEVITKKLTQFFADAMDDFFQLQKEKELQIELLDKGRQQDESLLN